MKSPDQKPYLSLPERFEQKLAELKQGKEKKLGKKTKKEESGKN